MVSIGSSGPDPRVARATTVPDLLQALAAGSPGPRLTWVAADGERVDLSGRVLWNWVAKTANLLREEFDIGWGDVVVVDLPGHWKWAVLELAVLSCGAWSEPDYATENANLLVTGRPRREDCPVLAVALPTLARAFDGDLAGAVDYAAEVAGHDDVFVPDRLDPLPAPAAPVRPGARVLLYADAPELLLRCLTVWRADGSVVLAEAGVDAQTLTQEGAAEWEVVTGSAE